MTGATQGLRRLSRSIRSLNISNISNSSLLQALVASQAAPAGSPVSPEVQAQSLLASSDAALFGGLSGSGSALPDLSGLTAAAQAYSLYTDPGLVQLLASGPAATGASAPGSGGGRTAAVVTPPTYAFNPFDQASWWTSSSLGATVDSTA